MQKLQSDTISYLRFPLIVLVVFIHSYNKEAHIASDFPIFDTIQDLISQVLARTAVPAFFLISGFLFFYNIKEWNANVYKEKLKKRFKSLVIPYFFWITLAILIYFVLQSIPSLSSYSSDSHKLIRDYEIIDFLKAYWTETGHNLPFLYPFWFIRDLIVIVLLSPLIYYFVKYLKIFGVCTLAGLWVITDQSSEIGMSMSCLFFYTLGAYFSINNHNINDTLKKFFHISLIYPAIAVADLVTKGYEINMYIHNIGIIIGVIFLFNITAYLIEKRKIKASVFLSGASFFVFAFHEPWLTFVRKLMAIIIKPNSEISHIIIYILAPVIVILIALLVYKAMDKICPKILKVISGGK